MKKLLSIILTIILIVSSSSLSYASNKNELIYKADTFMDLDAEGKKLTNKESIKTSIEITNFELNIPTTKISGKLIIDEQIEKDFLLTGELNKAKNSDDLIIGNLRDETGNFDVIYFAIDKKPEGQINYNKEIIKEGKDNKKTVFKLYLLEKNTRNFTVLEIVNPSIIDYEFIFKNINDLNISNRGDQYWYSKILLPIKFEEIEVTDTNDISILNRKDTYTIVNYRYSYQVMGGMVYEDFLVKFYLNVPGDTMYDGWLFTTKLSVYDEETWSLAYPSLNDDDTFTSIGKYGPTHVDTVLDVGQKALSANYSGGKEDTSGLNVTVGVNLLDPLLGISFIDFSLSYEHVNVENNNGYTVFDTTSDSYGNQSRQSGIMYENGIYLDTVGDSYDVGFNLGQYGYPGTKTFKVQWTFDLLSDLDYTWGGEIAKSLSNTYITH